MSFSSLVFYPHQTRNYKSIFLARYKNTVKIKGIITWIFHLYSVLLLLLCLETKAASGLSKVGFHRKQTLRQICIHKDIIEESFEKMYMRKWGDQEWLEEIMFCCSCLWVGNQSGSKIPISALMGQMSWEITSKLESYLQVVC